MTTNNHFLRRMQTSENPNSRGKSHRNAPKQERKLADRVGGRLVPRSGAGHVKGDVRVQRILRIEAKTTQAKSFSVTREMIDKIETAAVSSGELPFIVIEFIDAAGRKLKEMAVCPTWVLDTLREE